MLSTLSMRSLMAAVFAITLSFSIVARADESSVPQPPHHTAAPWVVVGVGAGVAALGILSFVGAVKAHDDVASESTAKRCTTNPTVVCPAGVDASNIKTNLDGEHAMNVLGVILTATGGAALIGGLIWHFLEPTSRHEAAFVIAPAIGPSYGGVGVVGRF